MNISLVRAVLALLVLTFVLAACSSSSGTAWTFAPTASESDETASSAAPTEAEASAEASAVAPAEPEQPTEPEASAEPETPAEPEEPTDVAPPPSGEARVIELEADPAIRFLQDGEQIREIGVTPGETVIFRIDNTAGFPHNFYIGADEDLQVFGGTTDIGVPDWSTGVQELEWTVPDDISNLRFACTVAGHYFTMQGDFTVSP